MTTPVTNLTPIEALIACHREMLDHMDRAESLAHELLADGAPAFEAQSDAWSEIVAFFRGELAAHTRDEEEGLFPMMAAAEGDRIDQFRFDHRWIDQSEQIFLSRYDGLVQQRMGYDSTRVREFALEALEIVGHYRRHVRKEEESLFPVAARSLCAEDLSLLAAKMREHRSAIAPSETASR